MGTDNIDYLLASVGLKVKEQSNNLILLDATINPNGAYLVLYNHPNRDHVTKSYELLPREAGTCVFTGLVQHESLDGLFEECKTELTNRGLVPTTSFQTDSSGVIVARRFRFEAGNSDKLNSELCHLIGCLSSKYELPT